MSYFSNGVELCVKLNGQNMLLDKYNTNNLEFFNNENFQNTMLLKQFLNNKCQSIETYDKSFNFVNSIVDTMCRLRFYAEENSKNSLYKIKNKKYALPISLYDIAQILTLDDNEPPQTIISNIAQQEFHIIDKILSNTRKVLNRKRQFTHISSVQQLDAQCLVWLTRQPGITPSQKAGSRQKILSVVREESFNTLENRVLKAFLKLCENYCNTYINEYKNDFSQSERLKAVRRLASVCKSSLTNQIFNSLPTLVGLPKPNYVLLHDPYYGKIWNLYQDLLKRTQLIEDAWKQRNKIFQEYFFMIFIFNLELICSEKILFQTDLWINQNLQTGTFFDNPFFTRVLKLNNGKFLEFSIQNGSNIHNCNGYLLMDNKRVNFSTFYIPNGEKDKIEIPHIGNHIFFVHNESLDEIIIANTKNYYTFNSEKQMIDSMHRLINGLMRYFSL